MTTLYRIITAVLLLFNGIGALYGGWNLIIHPDGSSIQLSMTWLEHTPFNSYLIPGIVLFIMNGLFSMAVFTMLILKQKKYALLVIFQGIILFGWIAIQMLMIQTVYFLHIVMGTTGVLLVLLGLLQNRISTN